MTASLDPLVLRRNCVFASICRRYYALLATPFLIFAAAHSLVARATSAYSLDAVLRAIIASPDRAAANVARDSSRHPYESLHFWGLRPGLTVIEVSPGGGYWTEILAPYAKSTGGTYVAAFVNSPDLKSVERNRKDRATFEARFTRSVKYGKIHFVNFGPAATDPVAPDSADLVLTARNVHSWTVAPSIADKMFADFFAVLRPGGILAIEEHRADPLSDTAGGASGYLATRAVVALARKAGFSLEGQSEINGNPKDTKNYPFGVWTLPPVRMSARLGQPADPNFDHSKYDAIGESDRMTLRFRKPNRAFPLRTPLIKR